MSDMRALTRAVQNLTQSLSKSAPAQLEYSFDPQPDMSLAEVIALLRTLNIAAPSDQYLDPAFPPELKRHFRPKT